MIAYIAVKVLMVIAIVAILRSYIAEYLFADRLTEFLQRRCLTAHYLFTCDECLSFWVVVALSWHNPAYILPIYGGFILYSRVCNGNRDT